MVDKLTVREILDEAQKALGDAVFAPLKTVDVAYTEHWSGIKGFDEISGKEVDIYHYFDTHSLVDGVFLGVYTQISYVPNETAITEIRALQERWKAKSWDVFDALFDEQRTDEDGNLEYSFVDELTDRVETQIQVKIASPIFTKIEGSPWGGFAYLMNQAPGYNAKITNLASGRLPIETR